MTELLLKEEVYAIIGAAMEVHKELGCGFLEPVYQEALGIELVSRRIPFEAQKELPILYKGNRLKKTYFADFCVCEQIIVEIKAMDRLTTREDSQVLNYLKASGMEVGVLVNFGPRQLEWKRLVKSRTSSKLTK